MKILVFDNYDSFTYNLVQIVRECTGSEPDVYRNDQISLDEIERYDKILLSPGPGIPSESGILLPLIRRYAPTKSIFGVCLGQQAIGEVFGAKLINLPDVYHGIASRVTILRDDPVFEGISHNPEVGRYHSWIVSREEFPESELEVTAEDGNGQIMALRHRTYDTRGVQFHPESVLTPEGKRMIANWLKI